MNRRALAILAALFVVSVVQFLGVVFLYGPLAQSDLPGAPLVPRGLGFVLSMALLIFLFDWVNRQMRSPTKAALTIAVSQILLVDVDYVLSGERGLAAGAASALLLLVSWGLVGWVYGLVIRPASH